MMATLLPSVRVSIATQPPVRQPSEDPEDVRRLVESLRNEGVITD